MLEGADLHEQIRQHDRRGGHGLRTAARPARASPRSGTSTSCGRAFRHLYHPTLTVEEAWSRRPAASGPALSQEFITEVIKADAQAAYDRREDELTPEVMRELERRVVLSVLDRKWREHLYEMDYLREGIGLRAMAQRDPLVEYQREGYDMFTDHDGGDQGRVRRHLFNLQVEVQDSPIVEEAAGELPAASLTLGQVPGNGAPAGVIEDSVSPAGPVRSTAPGGRAAPGRPVLRRSAPAGGATGGRGSRGRHAKRRAGPAGGRPAASGPAAGERRSRRGAPGLSRRSGPAGCLQRAERGRRGTGPAQHRSGGRRRVRQGRPQRPVPLRLGPQVQAVPRRPAQPPRQADRGAGRSR